MRTQFVFRPYYLIPLVVIIIIAIWRYVKRRQYLKRLRELQESGQVTQKGVAYPQVGTANPAFPTPQSGMQMEAGGFGQAQGSMQTGAGGFVQPQKYAAPTTGTTDPPPYAAVGYGFDQSKYGSGFDSSKYSSDNNYDPISR